MMSNTLSDGYVGGDWIEQAEATGKDIVKECGKGQRQIGQGRDSARRTCVGAERLHGERADEGVR